MFAYVARLYGLECIRVTGTFQTKKGRTPADKQLLAAGVSVRFRYALARIAGGRTMS